MVNAPAESALQPEDGREGGGNQQQIIKSSVQKSGSGSGLKDCAVEDVSQASQQTKWIEEVAEGLCAGGNPHSHNEVGKAAIRVNFPARSGRSVHG